MIALMAAAPFCASCKRSSIVKIASLVSFEGRIDMTMTTPGAAAMPSAMSYEVKGAKARIEIDAFGTPFVTVTDMSAQKSWTFDATTHTYTELDQSAKGSVPAATKSAARATNTGRHDTIAGYACDVWAIDDPTAMRAELCMASGMHMISLGALGPFSMFASTSDAWSEVMSKGFPLRIELIDRSSGPFAKIEATRISKTSIPDSEFEVPAGYTKRSI